MKRLGALLITIAGVTASCSHGYPPPGAAEPVQPKVIDCQSSKDGGELIDINKAGVEELQSVGIGAALAARIVEYRNRHGRFRRAVDVIIVEGFSEKKYHAVKDQICAGD